MPHNNCFAVTIAIAGSIGMATAAEATCVGVGQGPIALDDLIQHKTGAVAHLWGKENMTFLPGEDGRPGAVLRVGFPAGSYSPGQSRVRGGAGFEFRAASLGANAACLSYRVRFPAGFDFVKGGKLPGLFGGDNPRGCVNAKASGFSARLMWRAAGAGELYLYVPGHDARCGQSIGRGTWTFQTGKWTNIKLLVVMNSPGAANGSLEVWVDGNSVVKADGMMLGTPTTSGGGLFFSTFFGGADASWATPRGQAVDFADFVFTSHGSK